MDQQYRSREAVHGLLHMDRLGHADVIAAQHQARHDLGLRRDMQGIKAPAQHAALPGAAGDHKGGGAQDQALDQVRGHAAHQRRRQAALGMAGKVNVGHKIQRPGIVQHRQGIGDPLVQRVIPEGPAAFAMAVQIKAQGGEARLPHGLAGGHGMKFFLVAGKAVQHDHQRAALRRRALQDGAQLNAVVHEGQFFHFLRSSQVSFQGTRPCLPGFHYIA